MADRQSGLPYMKHDTGRPDPHAGHQMTGDQAAHDRHAGHSVAMFRDKFWLSFALTIPVVIWSRDVQRWFGYTAPSFPGSNLIPAVLGTLVFIYGVLVFIRAARRELAEHKPGMMTLISLAILVAFGTSLATTFGVFEIEVWWELATLITIMLLGHWLEMQAISQARGALKALADIGLVRRQLDHALASEQAQCLADHAPARAELGGQIGLDQPLSRNQPTLGYRVVDLLENLGEPGLGAHRVTRRKQAGPKRSGAPSRKLGALGS